MAMAQFIEIPHMPGWDNLRKITYDYFFSQMGFHLSSEPTASTRSQLDLSLVLIQALLAAYDLCASSKLVTSIQSI